jgi:hemolysin activation/secretion protein
MPPIRTGRGLTLAALLLCCLASPAAAQNFRRYQPQQPENTEGQAQLPEDQPEVTGDPRILVAELKALVFVDNQDRVAARPALRGGIYVDEGSNLGLPRSDAFRGVVGPYLGGPVSIRRLNELVRDIILFYRRNDQPVVDVSIPEQDITEGVVQVVITEGRIGRVRVEGACFFKPGMLLRQSCMSPGGPIYESALLEDLRWLNRNPFREVDLELTPGQRRGLTDVVYNVRDRMPLRAYMGYDDTGTRPTGLERTFYGFNWGNALWSDHQLGYQFTGSSDFKKLNAHSFVYSIPLLNRDTVDFWGSYAEVSSPFVVPFDNDGVAWQAAMRYNRELVPWQWGSAEYRHQLVGGFDYKSTNTNLEFGGVNVFASSAALPQFVLGYRGGWAEGYAGSLIGIDGVYGFSGAFGGNNDADYQTLRAGAEADYFYGRMWFERRFWMPLDFSLVARMTGQLAEGNLLPSEQLGFGGFDSIRGYDMRLVNGDSGYFGTVEVRTPAMNMFANDQLQLLTFYDCGDSRNHTLLPGEDPSVDLNSTGLGLRYILNPEVLLRVDYGWQISEVAALPSPRERWHVGVVLAR